MGPAHLQLETKSLLRVRDARDAGMEGRGRLAKGIAGDVVASLIVDDVESANHLVLPDDGLLLALAGRRPAPRARGGERWKARGQGRGQGLRGAAHMAWPAFVTIGTHGQVDSRKAKHAYTLRHTSHAAPFLSYVCGTTRGAAGARGGRGVAEFSR